MSIGKPSPPFKQRHSERFLTTNIIPKNDKYNTRKDELNDKFNTFNAKLLFLSLTNYTFAAEINQRHNMKQKLQRIASELESVNRDLRREEQVMSAELKDRLAKHIEGDAAIEHFNAWMSREGMNDLIIK